MPEISTHHHATSKYQVIRKQPGGDQVGHGDCSECTNDENANNAGATDAFFERGSFLPRRIDSGLDCIRGLYGYIDDSD